MMRHHKRGAHAIEFAQTMPLFVLIVTAIMEFGQPTPVTRIQVKGIAAGVPLLAGGTPA